MDKTVLTDSEFQQLVDNESFVEAVWNKDLKVAQKIALKHLEDWDKVHSAMGRALRKGTQ